MFEECGRRFRVEGLDVLEGALRRASGDLGQLIYDRYQAGRVALEGFYGGHASEFAARVMTIRRCGNASTRPGSCLCPTCLRWRVR